jgi:hypothetical protein
MKGAPAKAIQDSAGHQSIAVTNRYMHLAPGALRSAIDLSKPAPEISRIRQQIPHKNEAMMRA